MDSNKSLFQLSVLFVPQNYSVPRHVVYITITTILPPQTVTLISAIASGSLSIVLTFFSPLQLEMTSAEMLIFTAQVFFCHAAWW